MKIENIKFKAKRLDNGEWIVGSLIRSTAGAKERAYIVDNFSSMSDYSVVGVDPSTVCQFTGFLDKSGREIYEGDILRSDEYPFSCMEDDKRDNYFGIIEWSDEEAMFLLTCVKNPKSAVRGISNGISDEITQQKLEDCELVGCIHDSEWQEKLNLKDE